MALPTRRRAGRIAAAVAGVLLVLVAAGVIAFHVLVDPARLADAAQERARALWGRELAIGTLSLQAFPRPAVRVDKIRLSNPPWATSPDFIDAEQVTAAFELLPLLAGRLEVRSLDVRGAKVAIEEGEDGTTIPHHQSAAPSPATPAHVPFPSLHYLRLDDVAVSWRPRDGEPVAWTVKSARIEADGELRNVELDVQGSRGGLPIDIQGRLADASRFGLEGATTPGHLVVKTASAEIDVDGTLPLHKSLKGHQVRIHARGAALGQFLAAAGLERKPGAAFDLAVDSREDGGHVRLATLRLALGGQAITGELAITRGERPRIEGKLASDRIDWTQAFLDSGGAVVPDPPSDKLYGDRPMAWGLVRALKGKDGAVDVSVASLKLRNGIELRNARATFTFHDERLEMKPFEAELLGGSARGSFAFDGARRGVRIDFDGRQLLLERWLKERGSKIRFTGGPMTVRAQVSGAGESMQDVAASISGPITLRMGPGSWHSEHAGEMEQMMTNAFAPKDSAEVTFQCAAASLPFRDGRATGKRILGVRTDASRLVTSGTVDFREGHLDLRGKVAAQKGVTLGLSTLADGVVIQGPLRKPKMALDEKSTGVTLARVGAAIATAGVTVLGAALAEAATRKDDPCEEVLRK